LIREYAKACCALVVDALNYGRVERVVWFTNPFPYARGGVPVKTFVFVPVRDLVAVSGEVSSYRKIQCHC
jgi:hypothetical protein